MRPLARHPWEWLRVIKVKIPPAWKKHVTSRAFTLVPIASDYSLPHNLPRLTTSNPNEWLIFLPERSSPDPRLEDIVDEQICRRPDVEIFYADEAVKVSRKSRKEIRKPSLDVSYLMAEDYIGFPIAIRAATYLRFGGIRSNHRTASLYDLMLRAISCGVGIERIPEILVTHDGEAQRSRIEDRREALKDWLVEKQGVFDVLPGLTPSSLQIRRRFVDYPTVTLVIPTCQAPLVGAGNAPGSSYLLQLLNSLGDISWPLEKLHVVVGDDLPNGESYSDHNWGFRLQRIVTRRRPGEPFNYARKMNALWRAAKTDLIVLMNDDLIVRTKDWLEALVTFSIDEDVGGVGARLLFPDGRLQHAGVAGGIFGTCVHPWYGQPSNDASYQDWALVHREWSMVTGAVFATRRSVLERTNGFDERLGLEYNDLDLCLRLKLLGYRIVYTPFAELIHFERSSRKEIPSVGHEVALFRRRWVGMIKDDPMYHPALSRDSFVVRGRRHRLNRALPH